MTIGLGLAMEIEWCKSTEMLFFHSLHGAHHLGMHHTATANHWVLLQL